MKWALAGLIVLALRWVEQQWPVAGWVLFLVLTLSLGMAHGVLDIVIMRHNTALLQGHWPAWALWVLYVACTLAVFVLAVQSFLVSLLFLISLSLWHFGEDMTHSTAQRLALGGAAVMWPALLQPSALGAALAQADMQGGLLLVIWQGMAGVWLLGALLVLWRSWPQVRVRQRLLAEIIALALLYAWLSPWLAFALYFAVFHSMSHIQRVGAAMHRRGLAWWAQSWGLALTLVVTVGLGLLAWWMQGAQIALQGIQLSWWVAFVTAVTVPHAALVSWARHWLR